jgi:hypothetical protein
MERILEFKDGIIGGEMVTDIMEILPETVSYFRQRKQYYEYYYNGNAKVNLNLEKIQRLNDEGYGVSITPEYVLIY